MLSCNTLNLESNKIDIKKKTKEILKRTENQAKRYV